MIWVRRLIVKIEYDLHRIDLGDLVEPDLVALRTLARLSGRNLSGVGEIHIKLYDIRMRYLKDKKIERRLAPPGSWHHFRMVIAGEQTNSSCHRMRLED
jgi:hypothetical protein